ncbi:MAG: type II toxin-antitoxin system Phd/YefM family antitoxin [Patescibacteria group bacterium]
MDSKTTLSISEARKRIFQIADAVQKPDTYYTLTENGRPKAVVMSAEEFESWQETREIMREFPDLDKDIAEAEGQFARGEYDTLQELLSREGFVLADKSKDRYGVSRRRPAKSKKRVRANR